MPESDSKSYVCRIKSTLMSMLMNQRSTGRVRDAVRDARSAIIIVVAFAMSLLFVPPVYADTTGFKCSIDGCKYAQGKVEYNATTVLNHSWWGSTASGVCDPTNNIQRWQLQSTAIYNDATGVRVWLYESGIWRTNCEIVNDTNPPYAWVKSANVARPANASSHFWWIHDPPGIDFYPYVRWDY